DQRHPALGRHPARQRHPVPRHPRLLLRRPGAARPDRRGAGADRGAEEAQDPRRPRRGRLPAADLHQADGGPADRVLRVHRASRLARLRQGQLQGALRGHRAGAGRPRQPL
ncbi:MAG: 4-hydroxyphenylpyruvate dioxygenase, partial [uncultured Nocardioides sp.]